MRRKLAVSAFGLAVAASFAPITAANAYCDPTWLSLTGHCNPCITVNKATGQNRPCPQ